MLSVGWIQDELVEIEAPRRRGVCYLNISIPLRPYQLNPPGQVWGKEKEIALIEAIVDNLPIAAVVFSASQNYSSHVPLLTIP